ncbi:MAG: hypothetical protein IKM21_05995 [Oscillospiraceae bacterium]|nr:hypothetical protein [Oscillospiraceae bacterium]
MEMDLKKVITVLVAHLKIIAAVAATLGIVFFLVSQFLLTPVYTSQTLLHVSNMTERKSSIVTTSDVQVSRELLDTCVVILNSRTVLDKVAEQSGLDYTAQQIKGMISAQSVSSTEIFKISVTHTNPKEAQIIADTITRVAPAEFKRVLNGGAVSIVDYATYPVSPSSPNVSKNTVLGILLGAIVTAAFYILIEAMDTRVRDEFTLEEEFGLPIIGVIPSFELLEQEKTSRRIKKEGAK